MKKVTIACLIALVVGVLAVVPSAQAITTQTALNKTFQYAKRACYNDAYCQKYAASKCQRYSNGVACWAWNYEQHNGRYTCRRRILWKNNYPYQGVFLTNWQCNLPGWNWG